MEVREPHQHLGHVHGDERLGELPEDVPDLQEGPVLDELHDDVEVAAGDGVRDVVHDVGVVQAPQEVDLRHQRLLLVFGVRVEFELLDSDEGTPVYVKALVDYPKTSFANTWP